MNKCNKRKTQCKTKKDHGQCFSFFGEISHAGEEKKNPAESNKGLFGN